ncbi:response regulator [bacterium]|nr:response regulator [bacterium]
MMKYEDIEEKPDKSEPRRNKLMKYTWCVVAAWTLILVGLLARDLAKLGQATHNLAIREALAHFQKDEAFRFWAATHGGFYVPTNERTPPNPYLAHIPERDIEKPSGMKLTLMNPAYALRQMNEEFASTYGVAGHITSLLPLRPENSPDDWEHQALESFETGEVEVREFTKFEGKSSLRLMRPLIVQEGCLKCHAHQGYAIGDVRGGVSVSVPLAAYITEKQKAAATHMLSYALIWIFGFATIIRGSYIIKKKDFEREHAQKMLQESYAQLEIRVQERTDDLARINQQLEAQAEELRGQSEELQNQTEELKGQNLELEMQRNQVEEATRLKSEFLSNMSHELRTPLNSIMALSRVLIMQAKDKLSEEENNYLEIVERNGKQLLSLINDILDLSKIEAGKMDFYLQTISLKTILNNIGDSLQPIVREKDLYFKMDIADDLPMIETDDAKLHQVLQNIISNSVKFTEKGGVDILVKYNSEKVCLTIKDTGIGIPEDELPHIFEEFRQVDGTSSRLYEGTGLGLAIAKKLIRNLGGDIQVKSKFEEGSIFIVTLPIKWHGVADLPGISTFQALRPEPEEKIILAGLEKVRKTSKAEKIKSETRILLVEDNETTVIQMKVVLEREGYKLDVTRDGRQALEYIKHTIPDGIILDLMMPEVDGFEVLEKIRNTEATRRIPVLILTAKNLTREDLSRLSANHIQQLVQKGDIGKEKLLFKIQLMLGNEPHIKEEEKRKKVKDKVVKSVKQIRSNRTTQIEGLPRVLVVEDNPDNMTTIKAILKDDYNVLEAYDGKQGLNIARTELPDVILLDIALPKMDGMEVVNVVKNSEELKNIPVIAVTARAMKADRDIIMAAGFDDYISKPIDQKLLLKRIEKWLRR